MNKKVSSKELASQAAKALKNEDTSSIQKSLAAGVLSQRNPNNQTGAEMEDTASKVLNSNKYSDLTQSFAASLVSQSNKDR